MTTNAAVEFLIWLWIAAWFIAGVAERLRIPYTLALAGGLVLGSVHLSIGLQVIPGGSKSPSFSWRQRPAGYFSNLNAVKAPMA
jgi:hypothetical protein